MIRALYSLAIWLAQPLLRRKLHRRGVAEPGYLEAVPERFGQYTTPRPGADAVAGQPERRAHGSDHADRADDGTER